MGQFARKDGENAAPTESRLIAGRTNEFWNKILHNVPARKPEPQLALFVERLPAKQLKEIESLFRSGSKEVAAAAWEGVLPLLNELNAEDVIPILSAAMDSEPNTAAKAASLIGDFPLDVKIALIEKGIASRHSDVSALRLIGTLPVESRIALIEKAINLRWHYSAIETAKLIEAMPLESKCRLIEKCLDSSQFYISLEAARLISTLPDESRPRLIAKALKSPWRSVAAEASKIA